MPISVFTIFLQYINVFLGSHSNMDGTGTPAIPETSETIQHNFLNYLPAATVTQEHNKWLAT